MLLQGWLRIVVVLTLGAGVVSAGCASAEMPVIQTAADPGAPVADAPMSNVLQPSFDPDALAPAGPGATGGHQGHGMPSEPAQADAGFTCVMHPEVMSDKPGNCPKCGMVLVPKTAEPNAHDGHKVSEPSQPTEAPPAAPKKPDPKKPAPKKPAVPPAEPPMPPGHKM